MKLQLTNENYFSHDADMHYISVSQFKAFEKCQAEAMALLMGDTVRTETTALLVGSYVDAYFEGTLALFKEEHPEIFKADGTLKKEFAQADYIIKRVELDELFMNFMSGQKQVIMTGEIADVPVKIKVDSLHPDRIVDLKVMRDFKPMYVPGAGRQSFIEAWRYDLQGAVYQEIVRQNTGDVLPFYIAGVTKETEPDIGIFSVPQEVLSYELENFKSRVEFYQSVKSGVFEPERCERCDWCKKTKVLTKIFNLEDLNDELIGD